MRNAINRFRRLTSAVVSPGADGPIDVAAAPSLQLREIARRFWPDARPFRRWIPVSLVLVAIGALIETAEIWLFKLLVDDVLVTGLLEPLVALAFAYLALTLLGGIVNFADEYLMDWLGERFLLNVRTRLFAHMQTLSPDALGRRRRGDLIARLFDDVRSIETFVLSGVSDALSALLRLIFFTGALFYLNWKLALVSLVIIPVFYVAAKVFSRLIKRASRATRRRSGSLSTLAEQTLTNAALVQSSNRQEHEVSRFREEGEGIIRSRLASTRINGIFNPVVDLLELTGILVVVVLGTLAVADGQLTLGGLLVFITYLTQLYGPVQDLGRLSNSFFAAAAGAERVIEILDEETQVKERPDARRLARAHGTIALEGVDFTYPGATDPALRDVSFEVRPGETLALVGPSGAGKSTLARLLTRFYDPDRGRVLLDGIDLRDLALASVRANVCLLLQEGLVLPRTARENIAYGNPELSEEELIEAARAAGAHDFILELPDGYETDLRDGGARLSGGQRQRIAIARAIASDSPVLILDEPGTGLDPEARSALSGPIRRLMQDRTTIVVSHDLSSISEADRTLVLESGQVTERGAHSDLLELGGTYERLWEQHHRGSRSAGDNRQPTPAGVS